METINVKGISYPVKTYIVKDKTDKLVCEGKLVKDQLDGFSYSLDLSSITENSAEQIKEVLEIINSKILNKKIIKRHKTEITTDENINDIFYKLTQEINNDFNTKDVVLTTNILITQTTLHPDKLKIIIRDFLINTFSLSSDGNHVNVTIEREINVIKITVDDNNTIIPKEIVPKIFMQDIKTITDYSGVSLYSAKILVKELKGKITVQNKKPAGNRFIVHIPE